VSRYIISSRALAHPSQSLFGETITTHYAYGCSAMADRVTRGPLVGRPYGGVSILIKNELRSVTECMSCADRFAVIRVGSVIIINVYLPCSGTADRLSLIDDVLQEAWSWRLKYPNCSVVIGSNFNTDLDTCNDASYCINNFANNHSLVRGDANFSDKRRQTYVNESLGHSSVIDYFICDTGDDIVDYSVLDPEINLSDHLPVVIGYKCVYSDCLPVAEATHAPKVKQLRWDHADLLLYYNTTMNLLYPLYH